MDSRDIGNEVSSNLARLPEIGPSHTHRKSSENHVELSSGISQQQQQKKNQGKSEGNDTVSLPKL